MRQYMILTKTANDEQPVALKPIINASLYNVPEVRAAIEFVRDNPTAQLVGVNVGTRIYSVVVTHADELKDNHFTLESTDAETD